MTGLFVVLASIAAGCAVAFGYKAWVSIVDRLNRAYEADLRDRMDRIALDTDRLSDWMRLRITGAIGVAALVAFGFGMPPVGLLCGILIYVLVPAVLEKRILNQRSLLRDQLVTSTRNLAGQIRGQAILVRALAKVAEQTPDPLGRLLRQVSGQINRNVPFKVALTDLKDRVQMDYVSLLVITLVIAYEKKEGQTLADLLDEIAHSLGENQRVDRKREADTAAGRLLVNLLAAFPVGFLGLFYLLDPEATQLVFSTLVGQFVLCVVAGIVWFSRWLANRILGQVV